MEKRGELLNPISNYCVYSNSFRILYLLPSPQASNSDEWIPNYSKRKN